MASPGEITDVLAQLEWMKVGMDKELDTHREEMLEIVKSIRDLASKHDDLVERHNQRVNDFKPIKQYKLKTKITNPITHNIEIQDL